MMVGAAATAAALRVLPAAAAPVTADAADRIIVDERFPSAAAFGDAAARRGHDVRRMRGDLTAIWRDDLEILLRTQPATLAGVTDAAALHCLEILAAGHRLRVTLREPFGEGLVRWVIAPVSAAPAWA
jgi:hypothetical protein